MFSSIHTDNLIVLATNPAPEGRHSCRFLVICKLHGLLVISFGNTWPLASFFFCNEFPPPLAQKLPKPLTGADLYSSFDSRSSSHNVSHQCWFFEASPTTWEIFVSWKKFPLSLLTSRFRLIHSGCLLEKRLNRPLALPDRGPHGVVS